MDDSDSDNASYDKLTDKEMKALAGFIKMFFVRGGQSLAFCSNCRWYQLFTEVTEKQSEPDSVHDSISKVM